MAVKDLGLKMIMENYDKLPSKPDVDVATYNRMCIAIAEAEAVDEVMEIRNQAEALAHYVRQAINQDAEMRLYRIKLRAERRAGEILTKMQKAIGARGNPGGRGAKVVPSTEARTQTPTISELGLTYNQSANFQKLAKVPKPEFERQIAADVVPTINAIIGIKPPTVTYKSPSIGALTVHGNICDLERDGYLDREPADILAGMSQPMIDDMRRVLPVIIEWLKELNGHVG
jgi:hypothetical protein